MTKNELLAELSDIPEDLGDLEIKFAYNNIWNAKNTVEIHDIEIIMEDRQKVIVLK